MKEVRQEFEKFKPVLERLQPKIDGYMRFMQEHIVRLAIEKLDIDRPAASDMREKELQNADLEKARLLLDKLIALPTYLDSISSETVRTDESHQNHDARTPDMRRDATPLRILDVELIGGDAGTRSRLLHIEEQLDAFMQLPEWARKQAVQDMSDRMLELLMDPDTPRPSFGVEHG